VCTGFGTGSDVAAALHTGAGRVVAFKTMRSFYNLNERLTSSIFLVHLERDPQEYLDTLRFHSNSTVRFVPSQYSRVNGSQELRAPSSYFLLRASNLIAGIAWRLRLNGAFKVARRIGLKRLFSVDGRNSRR
jgi:hypothetical protein